MLHAPIQPDGNDRLIMPAPAVADEPAPWRVLQAPPIPQRQAQGQSLVLLLK